MVDTVRTAFFSSKIWDVSSVRIPRPDESAAAKTLNKTPRSVLTGARRESIGLQDLQLTQQAAKEESIKACGTNYSYVSLDERGEHDQLRGELARVGRMISEHELLPSIPKDSRC